MFENKRAVICIMTAEGAHPFWNKDYMKCAEEVAGFFGTAVLAGVMTGSIAVTNHDIPDNIPDDKYAITEWIHGILDEAEKGNKQYRAGLLTAVGIIDLTDQCMKFAGELENGNIKNEFDLLSKKLESGEFSPLDFGCEDVKHN